MDFLRISSSILRSNWRLKCVNTVSVEVDFVLFIFSLSGQSYHSNIFQKGNAAYFGENVFVVEK